MTRIFSLDPRWPLLALGVLTGLFLSGCYDDELPTAPSVVGAKPVSRVDAGVGMEDGKASMLAKGLALAAADVDLRRQILIDLRDSPFPRRALHLTSYLRSARGTPVVDAAAGRLGVTPDSFIALAHGAPLKLVMPRVLDRVNWTGTPNILVFGTARRLPELIADSASVYAFTTSGDSTAFDPYLGPKVPLLMIAPVGGRDQFGVDPERTRRSAPGRHGSTISTPPEEIAELRRLSGIGNSAQQDPLLARSIAASGEIGIDIGKSWSECTNPVSDADGDGLDDECEYLLAEHFQPVLTTTPDAYLLREPYFAARPSGSAVMIFYLMAYHSDIAHDGDSEFIELMLYYQNGRWVLDEALYSAHWNTLNDHTAYYGPTGLTYWDAWQGAPFAFVVPGKHANYNKWSSCSLGDKIFGCSGSWTEALGVANLPEFRGISNNIGSNHGRLVNCQPSYFSNRPGTECLWTGSEFAGWHSSGGVTGYGEILEFFGWKEPLVSVSIDGPRELVPTWGATDVTWSIAADGGFPPYTYRWYVDYGYDYQVGNNWELVAPGTSVTLTVTECWGRTFGLKAEATDSHPTAPSTNSVRITVENWVMGGC